MSRIPTPATIEAAPKAAQPLLESVKKQLGSVPSMFRLIANSPAALEGYLGLVGALGKGTLPAAGLYDRILREIERPLIVATLGATRGNQIKAAHLLGLNRNTLRKKIRELDIEVMRGLR